MDCPYTFMQDMVSGTFRLPWEDPGQDNRRHILGLPGPDARLWGEGRESSGITASLRPAGVKRLR